MPTVTAHDHQDGDEENGEVIYSRGVLGDEMMKDDRG